MPTPEQVQQLMAHIKNSSDVEYVFSRLKSVDWIPLLVKAGLYSSPYEPVPERDGYVFPSWPQSRLLARLAAAKQSRSGQKILIEAAFSIPETSNSRIHADLIDVALALDADLSARISAHAENWVRAPFRLTLPLKLGNLISHLAKGGEVEAALRLSRSVLGFDRDRKLGDGEARLALREPTAFLDTWEYQQVLEKNMPDVLSVAPERTLGLLCDLLDASIRCVYEDSEHPFDRSEVWRPAIEDHQQNLHVGIRDLLVDAVRDSAERIARKNGEAASSVIALVKERVPSWNIFERIVLHLLRLFPEGNPELLRQEFVSRENFDSATLRHEYYLLQKDCFNRLSEEGQEVVLQWVAEGPKYTGEQLKSWEEFTQKSWTEEDKSRYVRQWKRDHFAPLAAYLRGEAAQEYSRLVAEEGLPAHPEFLAYYQGGSWGPAGPSNREELARFSVRGLVDYLAGWHPPDDWFMGPTLEGLGRQITEIIAAGPEMYAHGASEFTRLAEPTYIRAVVQGFHGALREKRSFPWSPVLELCVWAVRQTRDIPGREVRRFEMDPHWGWTRAAVCRLLIDGFSSDGNPIPFELHKKVWLGIEPATNDPDPDPIDEGEYWEKPQGRANAKWPSNSKLLDPFTYSMNATRGIALEAAIRYALWLKAGFEGPRGAEGTLALGFDAMPEVRRVLDFHLDRQNDGSVAIRAVYGQRAPWLQLLDEKWAEANAAMIFPRGHDESWHAAWDSFIGFTPPFDKVFDWLDREYAYAVTKIGTHLHRWTEPDAPDEALGHHLMVFFLRGKLDLGSEILQDFYRRAGGKLRSDALNFVGRSLKNTKEALSEDVAARVKSLWNARLLAAKSNATAGAEELRAYGWLFASAKLDDRWSMSQLLEALQISTTVEPNHLVVERLVELSGRMPAESISALAMLIERDVKDWMVLGWPDNAKQIIRAARKSGDVSARRKAEELVDLLGSRGQFDFGVLLKESVD